VNNLELHYFLEDGKHSMNALVKNRAEHELLKLILEISSLLEIEISIEIGAMEEGGIKEIIKFFSKHKNKGYLAILVYLSTIIGNVTTEVVSHKLNEDKELDSLTKVEKKLSIRKLQKELETSDTVKAKETVTKITTIINNDYKVQVFKSRFYTQVLKEDNLYRLSLTEINGDKLISKSEFTIDRNNFRKQILDDENGALMIIDNAHIDIISPVLKPSEMKWKGTYNGKPIAFELKDSEFRNDVMNKKYSFSNGTSILCKLSYKEGVNDNGELFLKEIAVYDVLEIYEATTTQITEKYKRLKALSNQKSLFDEPN